MNSKAIIIGIIILCTGTLSYGQHTRFPSEGTIEFERTINMYAMFQKKVDASKDVFVSQFFEQYKKTNPQFKTLKSTLYFSKDKTLFKPTADLSANTSFFANGPDVSQINTSFMDLTSKMQTVAKVVFEEKFLVRDSIRKINWKITDETREIAGYACRRANAVIMDSVYVVAFYTDQIPVSGGPESFSGLPGMILGLALPHDNVTWFAKSVVDKPVDATLLAAPQKGKVTDANGLSTILKKTLANWNASDQRLYLKSFML